MDYKQRNSQQWQELENQIEDLQEKISDLRGFEDASHPLAEYVSGRIPESKDKLVLKQRRVLSGHFGKVYALDWGLGEEENVVTAAQDGKLIVWTTLNGQKKNVIDLASQWVMACGYSTDVPIVGAGGLDNQISLFRVEQDGITTIEDGPQTTLAHHEGYISSCEFVPGSPHRLLSGSGDANVILWDIKEGVPLHQFSDHESDVMSITVKGNLLVSGSCDATARLWDMRVKDLIRVFPGHNADVNCVSMFPDGKAFVSCSDDGTTRLFDIRANRELNLYEPHPNAPGVTSCDVSHSGGYVFSGYENILMCGYNTLTGGLLFTKQAHDIHITALKVSTSGQAIATGSWDCYCKVWAP